MILLKDLRLYAESLAVAVPELVKAMPITIEANMADRIGSISEDESPVLFFLPPSGQSIGRTDAFREDSLFVLFVMKKYNPRKCTAYQALEDVHPVAEKVKAVMLKDAGCPCHFMRIDVGSITTMPETEFFGNWAGWSIGFTGK